MTTKQIADAIGKPEKTVRTWAFKAAAKSAEAAAKSAEATPNYPADWDLDETCAIIEIGLGKNAASLYRENARHAPATPAPYSAIGEIVRQTVTAMLPALVAAVRGLVPETALALPPAATMGYREQLRRVINTGAARIPGGHQAAWSELYTQYYYRYHRNLRECAKNRGMDTLDYAENEGIMPDLVALAISLYGAAA